MPFRVITPCFKGCKENEAAVLCTAKEKAAVHSPLRCWTAYGGLPCAPRIDREFENSDTVWTSHTVTLRQVGVCAYLNS